MPAPNEVDGVDVVSDDQLAEKQNEVQQLREELARTEADRVAREQAKANSATAAQLDSEAERLRALIAAAKGDVVDLGQDKVGADRAQSQEEVESGSGASTPNTSPDPNTYVPGTGPSASASADTTGEGE
jgi:hypothetical protein